MTARNPATFWAQLSPSAQQALVHAAERLLEGHSGTIELHCHKGGVRLVRVSEDFRPGSTEFKFGEDVTPLRRQAR